MNRESVALGIAGTMFGLLVGWIIGSQSARPAALPPATFVQASAPASGGAPAPGGSQGSQGPAPALDERRVKELTARADAAPEDAAVRSALGNIFFDAERYPEAIKWYEASLALEARNANVSTDLGVAYYYANQPDRALAQFARSLELDPKHTKTLLNIGVVRAFGKQDLNGATQAWQQVLTIAPDSAEARAARQMIEAVRSAHPEAGPAKSGT